MESSGNLSYNKGVKSDKNWVIEESRFSDGFVFRAA